MTAVMVGGDLASVFTLGPDEQQLAALEVVNDSGGYRDMLRLAKRCI